MRQPIEDPGNANARCPLCDRPIVIPSTHSGGSRFGPMFAPAPKQELIAACAIHGHPPFNDRTRALDSH